MKTYLLAAAAAALACPLSPAFAQTPGHAPAATQPAKMAQQEYRIGDLTIRQPWTRATPKGAPVAGGYVTITNNGKTADMLTGGAFSGAGMVQIHAMSVTNGVMKMRHLEKGLEIKPGASITLKPGGLHLMFIRLKGGVATGKPIKGSLVFARAGKIDVMFAVAPLGSTRPPAAKQGHKH